MQTQLHLQFRMFWSAGDVPCASLDEARALFGDYAGNAQRREREGVTAVWVTHGGETVLGEAPAGWTPVSASFFQLYNDLRLAERIGTSRRAAAELRASMRPSAARGQTPPR